MAAATAARATGRSNGGREGSRSSSSVAASLVIPGSPGAASIRPEAISDGTAEASGSATTSTRSRYGRPLT